MVVSRTGHVGFVTTENEKLTSVEVRPDSLVRLESETGWAVIDPGEVVAVAWDSAEDLGGPIPVSGTPAQCWEPA